MFLIPSHPHFVSPSIFPATSFGPRWKPMAQRVENKRFDIKSSRACSFLPFDFKSLIWSILHWTSLVSCLLSPVLHSCSYTVHLPVFLSFSVTVKFLESPSKKFTLFSCAWNNLTSNQDILCETVSVLPGGLLSLYYLSVCSPSPPQLRTPESLTGYCWEAWPFPVPPPPTHSIRPPTLCWSGPVAEDTLMRCSARWPWLGWGHNSFHSFLLNP